MDTEDLELVVMADDDKARQVLQPTVRHVLNTFKGFLMALHHMRNSYGTYKSHAQRKGKEIHRKRKARRNASQSRLRKRRSISLASGSQSDIPSEELHENDTRFPSASEDLSDVPVETQPQYKRKKRLGLRDWSDILGAASIVGLEPSVIERAATRCADLFGEGMAFRILEEGKDTVQEKHYVPSYIPQGKRQRDESMSLDSGATDAMSDEGVPSEDEMTGGVHVDGFLKPIEKQDSWKVAKRKQRRKPRPTDRDTGHQGSP
ncbi:MAG: hypothetical protein Q9190_000215 [Brigantiaea leucoxantha]